MSKLQQFKPAQVNANKHTVRGLKALQDAMRAVGYTEPMVAAADGEMLSGSARLESVADVWGTDVEPIVVESDGTRPIVHIRTDIPNAHTDAAKVIAISSNRIAQIDLEWNPDVLLTMPDALIESLWNPEELSALGDAWAKEQPEAPEPQIDKAAELQAKWGTATGQLWEIGKHRLICGDCTDQAVVERVMGGEKAALCFTSPPYSDQRDYRGDADMSPEHLAMFIGAATDTCSLFAVNVGLCRRDYEIVTYWDAYIAAARACGLKFLSWNVWDRSGFGYTVGQATAMFTVDHEWILVFGEYRELNATVPNKDAGRLTIGTRREKDGSTIPAHSTTKPFRQLGTVVRLDVVKARSGNDVHPAMFPEELPGAYIEACSDRGGIVYDPFSGSGTTLVACERLGRIGRGVEIDAGYCAVTLQRLADMGLTPVLLENGRNE